MPLGGRIVLESSFNVPFLLGHLREEWKYLEFLSPSANHLTFSFFLVSKSLHLITRHSSSCTSPFLLWSPSPRLLYSSISSSSFSSFWHEFFLQFKSSNFSSFHTFNPFFRVLSFSLSTKPPQPWGYCALQMSSTIFTNLLSSNQQSRTLNGRGPQSIS